ncbi:MAG TPA: hypothetical protein EYH48_05335 [Aquifex aeolicus]|uniref:Uncharacterized protein n=1 Tax=Aquifex aeolicus TaxID=63363 RepID=A0A9D0YN54_AQUAO|nr:hypothetical protein [Aquificales bacterium]HIP98055.1 hypothetical protein [Aquifex aeolicus]HIQ26731.1 hypothetical protein [Aquifex aeolicus]
MLFHSSPFFQIIYRDVPFKTSIRLIGVLSAYLFVRFLGFSKTFFSLDYYIYNPLLVGLGIGFLFKLSPLTVALVVVSSILTVLLTLTLSTIFVHYLRLPVLSPVSGTVVEVVDGYPDNPPISTYRCNCYPR